MTISIDVNTLIILGSALVASGMWGCVQHAPDEAPFVFEEPSALRAAFNANGDLPDCQEETDDSRTSETSEPAPVSDSGSDHCHVSERIILGPPGYCYIDCLGHCEDMVPCVWTDGRTHESAIRKIKNRPGQTCAQIVAKNQAVCDCKDCDDK